MARELVGVREFARRRGVSAPYISQLIAAGRIPKHDGKIDAEEANAVLDAVRVKADGKKQAARTEARSAIAYPAVDGAPPADRAATAAPPAAASAPAPPSGSNASGAYTTARAVRETTLAKLEQLNLRQRLGELVEVEALRRGVAEAYAPMVRELRSMPDRIGGRMHAEPNERAARDLLSAEIERTLARIAEIVAALPESIGKTRQ